jgi:hypothetical protein
MSDVAAAPTAAAVAPPAASTARSAWHNPAGFGFRDILDIVNPLQHIPVISSIYRWVTGDRPGEAAQIAGDALYGGPIGVAFGLLGAATEDSAGHDLGEHVLAQVFGPGSHDAAPAATASAAPSPPASTATAASATPARPPLVAAAVADHPPMPLYPRAGRVMAAAAPAAPPTAAGALIAHNAKLERQIGAGVRAGPSLVPVPLVLPAGALPSHVAAFAPAAPSPGTPVDISQKMLDGLDKYRRLEQERKAAPQGVDLAL